MATIWLSIRTRSLVLLAYVLVVAAGLVSPAMAGGDLQIICTGTGVMKVIVVDDDGKAGATTDGGSMSCPLCQTIVPPPTIVMTPPAPLSPLAHATRPVVAARLAALTRAPLPPRGPPAA